MIMDKTDMQMCNAASLHVQTQVLITSRQHICMFRENHCTLSEHITCSEVHNTVCTFPIPASSSTLLVVVFHGLADGVVDDKPYVLLVNSHAKCHSSYNHLRTEHLQDGNSDMQHILEYT